MRLYRYRVKRGRLTVESARGFISDKARRGKMAESALWKAGLNWALPDTTEGEENELNADGLKRGRAELLNRRLH